MEYNIILFGQKLKKKTTFNISRIQSQQKRTYSDKKYEYVTTLFIILLKMDFRIKIMYY